MLPVAGWCWSARSTLAGLFIGLELLSVPTYGMIAYAFFNKRSLEAGIKYMVLSAAGSARFCCLAWRCCMPNLAA